MQQLAVEFMSCINSQATLDDMSLCMDKLKKHSLHYTPWPSYPYKPNVQFSIAYTADHILLKYFVTEEFIRAAIGKTNGNVWEDSCVEFFISFDEKGYYNCEFNCIGTTLIGFGKEKHCRELLPEANINRIRYISKISKQHNAIHWELMIAIPFDVFVHDNIVSLQGKTCKANFYKCGDALPQPHYVSWSNIIAPQPDFHLPEFFGTLFFA